MSASSDGRRRLTIGQLAARTGASHRSLRHYEAEHLLSSDRAANGYRRYDADAVELVQRIKGLLALGLPLRVVRELLPCVRTRGLQIVSGCRQLRDTLDSELRRLDAVEAQMQETRRAITAVLRTAEMIGAEHPIPIGHEDPRCQRPSDQPTKESEP